MEAQSFEYMAAEDLDLREYSEHGDASLRGITYWADRVRSQLNELPEEIAGEVIASVAETEEYIMRLRTLPVGGLLSDVPNAAPEVPEEGQGDHAAVEHEHTQMLRAGASKVLSYLGVHFG